MLAVHLVTVHLCAAAGRLPRLVRRKVAMLCAFTIGFQKVLRVTFYFSWLHRFNWHSCTVASLKIPAMMMNVLDTKWFPQHIIAGLISGITFVLFQSGEASTFEGNKHTHSTVTFNLQDISTLLVSAVFKHIDQI